MRMENQSGIYWEEIDNVHVSTLGDEVQDGDAVKVATFAGVCSEYQIFQRKNLRVGSYYEAYEFPTSRPASTRAGEFVRVWKCQKVWYATRAGFAEMCTYFAVLVSDVMFAEGADNHKP